MIKNSKKLEEFNKKLIAEENLSHKEALAIYEGLHNEAVSLGVISSENGMDGIETVLRVARALNSLKS
jgi:methanogenic corrinoid protein MtbC1